MRHLKHKDYRSKNYNRESRARGYTARYRKGKRLQIPTRYEENLRNPEMERNWEPLKMMLLTLILGLCIIGISACVSYLNNGTAYYYDAEERKIESEINPYGDYPFFPGQKQRKHINKSKEPPFSEYGTSDINKKIERNEIL